MKTFLITAAGILGMSLTACAQQPAAEAVESAEAVATVRGMPAATISQEDFIRASEQTVNGVVSVKSYATPRQNRRQAYGGSQGYADPFSDPFLEFFFGGPGRQPVPQQQPEQQQPRQRQIGLGSGVIISADGYIVTNNHVVAEADRLEVTLNDNRNFEATVVGTDPTTDIALLKIEAPEGLQVIPMGDSEHLHVGEWVLAVGNPFGFTSTVTSGIVSAKARNIASSTGSRPTGGIESYIQTDAAVNSGNSGGALVNLRGELVGINTAIYSQTGAYAGCSFAIPVAIVQKVTDDLRRFGTVQRALLGIRFQELTPELIAEKGVKGTNTGVYVHSVEDFSAAREAGLRPADVVMALNDAPTATTAQMQEAITKFSPGDRVTITYIRDGQRHTAQATLRNAQGTTATVREASPDSLGATFKALTAERLQQLRIGAGVEVESVAADGPFAAQGVRPGFIILAVNQARVASPDDIRDIARSVLKADSRERVLFISGFYPEGRQAFYAIDLNN
ncbi:MAG: Do family serine endopeptidase [Muribaculaceae bacterium]|nr:Do family serine endopeptidase [Muribaculaceae bacterium]